MYKIKNGEKVKVKTKDDTWAAVEYGKYRGYVMLEFLVFDAPDLDITEESKEENEEEPTNIQTVYYEVKKGDTLWGIAKEFYGSGISYKRIMKANGLKSSVIRPGKKLKLPDVECDG